MRKIFILFCAMMLATITAFAATPVATLTVSDSFTLDGHAVALSGVNSWPVVIGDTVSTQSGTAVLRLQNGSQIKIAAHSTIQLTGTSSQPKVDVKTGSVSSLVGAASNTKSTGVTSNGTGTGGCPNPCPGGSPVSCYY